MISDTKNIKQYRRYLIVRLYNEKLKQSEIASILSMSQGRVSQILKLYKENGEAGLEVKKSKGAKPKLSYKQLGELIELLNKGPREFGYDVDSWTLSKIKFVLEKNFDISYSERHISRIMEKENYNFRRTY